MIPAYASVREGRGFRPTAVGQEGGAVERPWETSAKGTGLLDGARTRMLRRRARHRGRPGIVAASSNGALSLRTFRSRHHISLRRRASGGTAVVASTSRRVVSAPRRQAASLAAMPLFFSSRARAMPARALMSARVSARAARARPKRVAPLAVVALAVPAITVLILIPQLRNAFDPGTSPLVDAARPLSLPGVSKPGVKHDAVPPAHRAARAAKPVAVARLSAPSATLSSRYSGPAYSRATATPSASYSPAQPVVYHSAHSTPAPTHSAPPPQ